MKIEQRIEISAPADAVWDACADPLALARLLGEESRVTPAQEGRPAEVGAQYRTLVRVGAALVGSDVTIVDHSRPREFAWTATTGIDHRLRIRLRAGAQGTIVTLRFAYDAPGVFGTLVDVAAYPRLRSLLRQALEQLKAVVEGDRASSETTMSPAELLAHEAGNALVLAKAGIIAPMRPDKLLRLALNAKTWGLTIATVVAAGAVRHPDREVIVDDFGSLTYREADRRTDAIAVGMAHMGIVEGDAVGVMVRNHRGFLEAAVAAAKLGCDVLLLNTAFPGPQIVDVCRRHHPTALIYDREFEHLLGEAATGRRSIHADPSTVDADPIDPVTPSVESLAREYRGRRPGAPGHTGRLTILTSGTTGTPKGASRGAVHAGALPTLEAPAALLEQIPLRAGMRIGLPAPAFHTWGLANLLLGLSLGATFVMLRRFDPERWLAEIARSRCDALIVVPVMLQRILELPAEVRSQHDTSSLTIVAASGSALPGDLAIRWMDAYGDNLYNLYGSTEIANAAIATPRDLRAAPGTVGRPTRGTVVKLFDDVGSVVEQGSVGRIFVGNAQLFEGYSDGGDKERIGGLMSSGDLGRFDESGRLFVVGRDDEMIVSGGENVFPKEVEDTLSRHAAVADVACIGVDDTDFGQRLRAFVVLRGGQDASADELRDHVREQLARYKVPRDVVFLDELPRNATGKVLKRELPTR